jgi:ATP-dependent helicase/nuclease subunit A
MTVHQSKGLEFHIVAVADLGKRFNHSDLQSALLLDEKYGVCAMIKPPGVRRRYPSLPLWLARRAQRQESAGEEMRVLYVALTRAENHLLLFGTTTQKRAAEHWRTNAAENPSAQTILKASSALDWIGSFATLKSPFWTDHPRGVVAGFSYWIHAGAPPAPTANEDLAPAEPVSEVILSDVIQRVSFAYPHSDALAQSAKTSVTTLRRRALEDEESAVFASGGRTYRGDGAERGVAMHAFLQHLPLEGAFDLVALKRKAENLVSSGLLRPDQLPLIDFPGLSAFWTSDTGRELLANAENLRREFPITYRLIADDLIDAGLPNKIEIPPGEFLVLQGVADLLMLGRNEIWLIDFKTDSIRAADVHSAMERYLPQLVLYGIALTAIYKRPVTRTGIFFIGPREFVWT